MYTVDERDRVVELEEMPQSSTGAPLPVLVADEGKTMVAYLTELSDEDCPDRVVIVTFDGCLASYFGMPNDEALSGHPLYRRGLGFYGSYEVQSSSWIRTLENVNSVHPRHRPEDYLHFRHFVLTFHDSLFECIARSFDVEVLEGGIKEALAKMAAAL